MNRASIKQPIRKVWRFTNGSLLVSLPKELGIREGDFVVFKIIDGQIVLEKLENMT